MQNPYDPPSEEPSPPPNPWVSVWTAPRRTVRWLAANSPWTGIWILAVAGGTSRVLLRVSGMPFEEALGVEIAAVDLAAAAIIAGPFAGATLIFAFGWLLHKVLQRLGGHATWAQSRTAVAWALAPAVPSLLLWAMMLATQGPEVLTTAPADRAFVVQLDYFLHYGLAIWSLVLEVLCLSDVHKLPYWKVIVGEIILGLALMLLTTLVVGGAA